MHGTRRHGLASGSIWVIILATVAWGGLGRSAGPGSVSQGPEGAAALVVDMTAPQGLADLRSSAPYRGFSYRFDGTPPTLDPVVTRLVVTRFGIVVAKAGAKDAVSGVARQGCNGNRSLSTRRLGVHTVTASPATVRATWRRRRCATSSSTPQRGA